MAVIEKEYRATGMGARSEYRVFNENLQEVKPNHKQFSKTGNHGLFKWFLRPGKYYFVDIVISNTGKHYCRAGILNVFNERYEEKELTKSMQTYIPQELLKACDCLRWKYDT